MKFKILFALLICSCTCFSQKDFSKKDFRKTEWFSENQDSLFYKSDTVRLIKRANLNRELGIIQYQENELDYFNHGYFVNFEFRRFGSLIFSEFYYHQGKVYPTNRTTWKFDKKEKRLFIFIDKKLAFKLKPISKREIKIKSKFDDQSEYLKTDEVTFVKENF